MMNKRIRKKLSNRLNFKKYENAPECDLITDRNIYHKRNIQFIRFLNGSPLFDEEDMIVFQSKPSDEFIDHLNKKENAYAMNTRIMKKRYKQHLLTYLLQKKINVKWDKPFMTCYGKTVSTVKQRYRHMIWQRTRCNEYIRHFKKEYKLWIITIIIQILKVV